MKDKKKKLLGNETTQPFSKNRAEKKLSIAGRVQH